MKAQLWKNILAIREQSPLVHSITNYVVMNNTANALLAAGASPVMAHAHQEMEEMVSIAGALVVNIGTLHEYWVESMRLAVKQARKTGTPWILDPVGAGATTYRNQVLKELVAMKPTIIRGNASEIMALAGIQADTKGVDSTRQSNEALNAAINLSKSSEAVVCVSGATDFIVQGTDYSTLSNGHQLMSRITGMGCTASALCGALCAVRQDNPFEACLSAMALVGVCGELAAEQAAGPGSLQMHFLDTLSLLTEEAFLNRLRLYPSGINPSHE